jgi:hypothetical protein
VRDQISFLHAVSSSIQVPEPSAGAGALAAAAALAALLPAFITREFFAQLSERVWAVFDSEIDEIAKA